MSNLHVLAGQLEKLSDNLMETAKLVYEASDRTELEPFMWPGLTRNRLTDGLAELDAQKSLYSGVFVPIQVLELVDRNENPMNFVREKLEQVAQLNSRSQDIAHRLNAFRPN